MHTLAVRYRPQTLSEVIGQTLTCAVLSAMASSGILRPGMLFSGPSGTGKTTVARALARALNPEDPDGTAVLEVDAASHGGVADVRALLDNLRYSSGTAYRICLLDEAHSLTRDAFNALLKTLEEPPPGVVFVLLTTEPHKIPETVASRLMSFQFRKVSSGDIRDRLAHVASLEGISADDDLLTLLSEEASGSVRDALMSLEKADLAGLTSAADWRAATGRQDVSVRVLALLTLGRYPEAVSVIDGALTGAPHASALAEDLARTLSDVLVTKAGGRPARDDEIFYSVAARLDRATVLGAIKILWDLKTRVRASSDPVSDLLLATALLGEVLCPSPPSETLETT